MTRLTRYLRSTPAWTVAMVVILSGCTASVAPPAPIPLRNPTAPLGGTTRFNAADFAGDWHTVACLGACAARTRYVQAEGGIVLRQSASGTAAYRQGGPGILRASEGDRVLVVMWVDEGFRTAAVGDADGAWAAVIDRRADGAADRLAAATEILDFYGWDVSRLQRTK